MSDEDRTRLEGELAGIEAGIAAQENLRGQVPDAVLETTLAALRVRRDDLKQRIAALAGSGAVAQGPGAVTVGGDQVGRDKVGGDKITVGDVGPGAVAAVGAESMAVSGAVGDVLGPGARKETHIHPPAGPDAADLRAAYLGHVLATAGRLSLSGVDPKAASDAESRLELNAVYTALLTLTAEECERMQRGERWEPAGRETRRVSALVHLERCPRLVLLGDPGSGKSTFVNFVALCLAGEGLGHPGANLARLTEPLPPEEDDRQREKPERQPWSHGALLPVRIVLRDLAARGLPGAGEPATAKHLWDFIAAELRAAALGDFAPHLAQELLKRGGLLLLDGLDEVPEAEQRRTQLKQAVEDFAASFGRCRILVTSRTYAYQQQAWRLRDFAEAVLAPFSASQIRSFVERWYAHIAPLRGLAPDDAQGRAELLRRAIFGSDRLRALAERPLLLTLMASLHAWRGGTLPEKREELYADTVDLLLDWWESPKVVRDRERVVVQQPSLAEWLQVDRARVRGLLNELAYRAHAAQPETTGTADVAEGDLLSGLMHLSQNPEVRGNPALLVSYLSQRAGLLLPRGVGVYTFPHRTFQEYLAACHLTDHGYPEEVAHLARSDPGRWREVALLAGAKSARGSDFALWALAEELCPHEPAQGVAQSDGEAWGALLAGQALVESANLAGVGERNREKVRRVVRHLVRLLEAGRLPAVERAAAGRALGELGDPRPGVGLRPDGLPDIAWCAVPAGPFTMGSREDDPQAYGDEQPQHEPSIPYPYRVARYPVTNAQYQAFVQAGGYRERRYWAEASQAGVWTNGQVQGRYDEQPRTRPDDFGEPFNLPNHPVVGVTWYEAVAFCCWLTEVLRERGELHAGQAINLPSEAQWEKAARGTDGHIYPWGNDPDPNRANYGDTGIGETSAVGCFPGGASPYGAEDMSGNVWEWTRSLWGKDWQKPDFKYPYDPKDGREDVKAGDEVLRVLRGGAFYLLAGFVGCAFRYGYYPVGGYDLVGFRIVLARGFL
jgi:formylglycine-generating enzyme required for sulfatase activity